MVLAGTKVALYLAFIIIKVYPNLMLLAILLSVSLVKICL